jgi:hypothetical protein
MIMSREADRCQSRDGYPNVPWSPKRDDPLTDPFPLKLLFPDDQHPSTLVRRVENPFPDGSRLPFKFPRHGIKPPVSDVSRVQKIACERDDSVCPEKKNRYLKSVAAAINCFSHWQEVA